MLILIALTAAYLLYKYPHNELLAFLVLQHNCYMAASSTIVNIPDITLLVALVVTKFLFDCVPICGLPLALGTAGFLLSLSGYVNLFTKILT